MAITLVIFFIINLLQALAQVSEDFIDPPFVGIINGKKAAPHSFPYQVGIFTTDQYFPFSKRFCGGSLISDRDVLTAAHCLYEISYVKLLFGAHRVRKRYEEGRVEQTVNSSYFIIHPKYTVKRFWNDIAIIRLVQPVDETDYIKVIRLANGPKEYTNSQAIFAGWGFKHVDQNKLRGILYYIENTIISNEECKNFYYEFVRPTNICLSAIKKYHDGTIALQTTYKGDSGSPLVVDSVQVGILSWGPRKNRITDPNVFVRVSKYYKWIQKMINFTIIIIH